MKDSASIWDKTVLSQRSAFSKLFIQFLITVVAIGFAASLYHAFHYYTAATTVFATILIVAVGDLIPSAVFSTAILLFADYFFIAPTGSVLETKESFEHFVIVEMILVATIIFVASMRSSYQRTLEAKQDAEKSREVMEKFLALVSHDVRNPLSAVKLQLEMLNRSPELSEKTRRLTVKGTETLARVDKMIQTLLDVSRMRSPQPFRLVKEYSNLYSIIASVVDETLMIHENRIKLTGEKELFGFWAADPIKRLVDNLIGNALKYGSPEQQIWVQLEYKNDHAELSVHNGGKPIPLHEQAHLFDIFNRASTSTHQRGWGLGLALVKGVAEAHGGSVTVKSTADHGTTFTVHLPIELKSISGLTTKTSSSSHSQIEL